MRYVYICPKCRAVFKYENISEERLCPDCNIIINCLGINDENWISYPREKKNEIISKVVNGEEIAVQNDALETADDFIATKSIGGFFMVDETAKKIKVLTRRFAWTKTTPEDYSILNYDQLISYELIENGDIITKGGLGRAAIGGLAFGAPGAIVGAITGGKRTSALCNSLQIKITAKGADQVAYFIPLVISEVSKGSALYQSYYNYAQQILSMLEIIFSSINEEKKIKENNEYSTEIVKESKNKPVKKEKLDLNDRRFTQLFSTATNLYSAGSPTIIKNGELLKDSETDGILARLNIKSVSNERIIAIIVKLKCKDIIGNDLGEVDYQYLDLNLRRDDEYGYQVPIIIDNIITRSFSAVVAYVVFEDRRIWKNEKAEWCALERPVPIETITDRKEIIEQYSIETGEKEVVYVPTRVNDLWYCVCGAINKKEEQICHICKKDLSFLIENLNIENLAKKSDERKIKENEQREAEIIQEEKRLSEVIEKTEEEESAQKGTEQRNKKKNLAIGIVLTVLAVLMLIVIMIVLQNNEQETARPAVGTITESALNTLEFNNEVLISAGKDPKYIDYKLTVKNIHIINDSNIVKRVGLEDNKIILSIQCILENLGYSRRSSMNGSITPADVSYYDPRIVVEDKEGFSLDVIMQPLIGVTYDDEGYVLDSLLEIPAGTKKKVAYLYEIDKDLTEVKIIIDSKYEILVDLEQYTESEESINEDQKALESLREKILTQLKKDFEAGVKEEAGTSDVTFTYGTIKWENETDFKLDGNLKYGKSYNYNFSITGSYNDSTNSLNYNRHLTKIAEKDTQYSSSENNTSNTGNQTSTETPKGSSARHTDAEAFTIACEIVKSKLKSPSTAVFCKVTEAEIEHLGNGRYWVKGWVDAQNSFGATLRQTFQVTYTAVKKGNDIGYREAECSIY